MDNHACVIFNRKSGKIAYSLTSYSVAMLKAFCFQHLTKTRDSIIFSLETGDVIQYYEGQSDGRCPVLVKGGPTNIDSYCPELMDAFK